MSLGFPQTLGRSTPTYRMAWATRRVLLTRAHKLATSALPWISPLIRARPGLGCRALRSGAERDRGRGREGTGLDCRRWARVWGLLPADEGGVVEGPTDGAVGGGAVGAVAVPLSLSPLSADESGARVGLLADSTGGVAVGVATVSRTGLELS